MPRVQTPSHLRREYECIYLIDQSLEDPQVDEVVQRYRETVTNQGGKVVQIDNWGKRKLAYEIHKQQKATYVYMQFLAVSGVVAELERTMRLADEVIRWQTVLISDQVDPAARPEASEVTRRVSEEESEETGRDDRRAGPAGDRTDDRPPRTQPKDDAPSAETKEAAPTAESKDAAPSAETKDDEPRTEPEDDASKGEGEA